MTPISKARSNGAAGGIFGASGQSCVAGSRLLLQDPIADAFIARMVEIAGSLKIGDPMRDDTEMGPICTAGQLRVIEREIARARDEGGILHCGGHRVGAGSDMFFAPTLIERPDPDLHIVDAELFGPGTGKPVRALLRRPREQASEGGPPG